MDTYLLMLYVSIEQELAIRELFDCRGWPFKKQSVSNEENYQDHTSSDIAPIRTTATTVGAGLDTIIKTEHQDVVPGLQLTPENLHKSYKSHIDPLVNSTDYKNEETAFVDDTNEDNPSVIIADPVKTFNENQIYVGLKEFVQATIESHGSVEGNTDVDVETKPVTTCSNFDSINEENEDINGMDLPTSYDSDTDDNDNMCLVDDGVVKMEVEENMDDNINVREECQKEVFSKNESISGPKKKYKKVKARIPSRDQVTGNYRCNECECEFKRKSAYDKHKQVHGQCLFVCEFCGKRYTYKCYYSYQIHLRYHKKEARFRCSICGKGFVEKHNLEGHMRKHSGEKPYVCETCGKSYTTSSSLSAHRRSHHEGIKVVEVFKCDICGLTLASKGGLKTHKTDVHVTERLFACEICGKRFKTKRMLEEKHATIHKDEYPHACDFPGCKKRFKRTEQIQLHRRRHLNQRTLFCEQCGKGFYTKRDLTCHLRTHSGEKPFSCKFCDYRCAVASNIAKHMKVHEGK